MRPRCTGSRLCGPPSGDLHLPRIYPCSSVRCGWGASHVNRRVYSLSEINAVIRTSIRIEKYGAEFFLDHFSLVGECILKCGRLNAKEVC